MESVVVFDDEPTAKEQISQKAKAMFEDIFKPVKAFKTWIAGKNSNSDLMLLN